MTTDSNSAGYESRDAIQDVWGKRTPYKHQWPTRVDQSCIEEPDKWVQSACVLCSNGCGLDIGVKDGKMVAVRGRETDRVNKGRLGPKGMYAWKSIAHPDRLKYPLIRKNGTLERASWDEAMDLIVRKTRETAERLSNHGIAFYTSGQLFLEEYYALALVGKAGLNTLHMDGNTRLCTATAAASMRESFGSDGQPGSYGDIDYTDCLFLVGHNMAATQTVLWSRILDRLAGPDPPRLIVVDPRYSDTAEKATVHLAPKIGTNVALLNGIQYLLFKNGWVNEDFVGRNVVDLDNLKSTIEDYPPDKVEKITGVPVAQLQKAAEIIGTTKSLLSTALQGVYQSNQATAAACQVNNINLLRGLIGKPGSGILQMNGQPTAQNNREAGCDGEFPGFRNHLNTAHMEELARLWNIDYYHVPHWNEPTHVNNLLDYMAKGSVQMLWVSGTNPMVSLPNLHNVRDILTQKSLFLVVQDIFTNETVEIADVVLPAAQWGEKTGCFTNVDRTVHISHKAVEPPGEAKSDLNIFLDYSRRMGFKDKDGNPLMPWETSEQVFEAWKKLSKGRPCDYSGMSYKKLTGGSGIQWPCNEQYPEGRERLFDDGVFFTDIDYCESFGHDLETGAPYSKDDYKKMNPAGRAFLKPCHYQAPMEEPDDAYPLRLATGRNKFHFHTRTKTGRSKRLQEACPAPEVHISEADAAKLNLTDGEDVIVRSRRGAIELPVKIGGVRTGQTFMPFHFGYFDKPDDRARAANELTLATWDPISKQPHLKGGAIRIEKLPDRSGEVKIHVKQQQSEAVDRGASNKPNAHDIGDTSERTRCLEMWFGETLEGVHQLIDIYDDLLPKIISDPEIQGGLRIMHRIGCRIRERLLPVAKKYSVVEEYGGRLVQNLRTSLFPETLRRAHAYEVLEALQGLSVYLSCIKGGLVALLPACQALWDKELIDAVQYAESEIDRSQAWVVQHIKVKSPQTLLVPTKTP